MDQLRCNPILRLLVLAGVVTIVAAAAAACGGSGAPAATPAADKVVAVVNGRPVHASDVAVVVAENRLAGEKMAAPAAVNEAIDRELLRQEASRLGAVANAAAVVKRIGDLTAQAGGADALNESLKSAAMSPAQLRQSVNDGILKEAVQNAEFPDLAAGGKAAHAYYARHRQDSFMQPASVHLRAITVRTEGIARNALRRLRQGRPFAEVARQFSIDPEARDAGGDLGLLLASSLPAPLRKAAMSAGTGLLARPVQVGPVWYVLDVVARNQAQIIPYATVRARIAEELTRLKRAKQLERWLNKARQKATVTQP